MKLTVNQRRKLKQGATMLFVGALAGPFYAFFANSLDARHALVNGFTVGVLLAAVLAICELWLFAGGVRRVRFISLFLFRIVLYLVTIVIITFNVFLISRMRRFDMSYSEVLRSDEFVGYITTGNYYLVVIFALVLVALVNFSRQMSRKLGQGMLMAYITGRYRTPQKGERLFMLVDVVASRKIASRLGPLQFHDFLNDLIYDITESIVIHRGIIEQYVDDEILVSWSVEKGLQNANCVRAYFDMQDELHQLGEKYYKKYGFVPRIRSALHIGPVIRAEIGEVKSEVLYFGDTINTTARILSSCHDQGSDLLVSKEIYNRLKLPGIYKYEGQESILLRGKSEPMDLYSVKEWEYEPAE